MPRLSIIVYCLERTDLLEETLITVLQNRPADCEVIVVHDGRYQDPYELGDEVRFLVTEPAASLAELGNLALRSAEGTIVHYLAGGVTVGPDWTASVMGHFDDPQVAAVTPVLRDARRRDAIACVGIRASRLLNRVLVGAGRKLNRPSLSRLSGAVPNLVAAFYSRSHLEAVGGFRGDFGNELTDLDLGLRLKAAEAELVIDVDCELSVSQLDSPPRLTALQQGRAHQRFVAEHLDHQQLLSGNLVTGMNGLLEILTSPRSPSRLVSAWGRLLEWRRGHHTETAISHETELAEGPVLSIDSARRKRRAGTAEPAGADRRAA